MNKQFEFLKSNRFWAMVIGAVALYLKTKGILDDAAMAMIGTITAGFVVVRTVDKVSGK